MATNMKLSSLIASRLLAALPLCLVAASPLASQDVAIRNATILTMTRGDINNGTIVVRNGKITAVGGANTAIPQGVRVIDGTGKFVMPGIIDAHSHAALENGINEGSESVTPEVQVQLKNDDPVIYRALAGGVTAANQLHGSANTIGGQSRVIKFKWGMRVDFLLHYWFEKAKDYDKEWQDYRTEVKKNPNALMPRRDLRLEALTDILHGDLKVHSHSYRQDEILMLIRAADEEGFKINTF